MGTDLIFISLAAIPRVSSTPLKLRYSVPCILQSWPIKDIKTDFECQSLYRLQTDATNAKLCGNRSLLGLI
jgi:hypothetical protein